MSPSRPKKRFSQNFIIDKKIARQIVSYLGIDPNDTVFEIGTGRGGLTEILAEHDIDIHTFELDKTLLPDLEKKFDGRANVKIYNKDFLTVVPGEYSNRKFRLIGNIPYDITSPLIDWIINHRQLIKVAVITTQKELAERIASGPGSKNWAPISIMTQLFYKIRIVRTIPPNAFYPPPRIYSSVLILEPSDMYDIKNLDKFDEIVRASFEQRRKVLLNNLVSLEIASKETLSLLFEKLGWQKNIRAEELRIEDFIKLTEKLISDK